MTVDFRSTTLLKIEKEITFLVILLIFLLVGDLQLQKNNKP